MCIDHLRNDWVPLPFAEEFEVVIMIEVVIEEMAEKGGTTGVANENAPDGLNRGALVEQPLPSEAVSSVQLIPRSREMSRRDGAIVAWHEVPGTASPQKSRPVGYGVIGRS